MDILNRAQAEGKVINLAKVDGVGTRYDIDKLLIDRPDQFNLFLLALADLSSDKERSNNMGFHQIAGIHGMPLRAWDGVGFDIGKTQAGVESNNFNAGYCPHGTGTFPTWHRPYLGMLEQSLYLRMYKIAGQYNSQYRQTYQEAVKGFRLPYWDYFRPRGGEVSFRGVRTASTTTFPWDFRIPDIFTREQIMVRTVPDNELVPMRNPLFSYRFPHPRDMSTQSDWTISWTDEKRRRHNDDRWPSKGFTERYPASVHRNGPTGELNDALNSQREANNELVCNMMTDRAYANFSVIVSNEFVAGQAASGSVEAIHNAYHGLIGGQGGQMSDTTIAAFDPVFWIHHCNVDRLFAIFCSIYPDEWYTNKELLNQDLLPFRHVPTAAVGQQPYWKSSLCRDTKDLGYIYPDMRYSTPQAIQDNFVSRYVWQVRSRRNPRPQCPDSMLPWNTRAAQVFQYDGVKAASPVATQIAQNVVHTQSVATNNVPDVVSVSKHRPMSKVSEAHTPKHHGFVHRVFNSLIHSDSLVDDPNAIEEQNQDRRWFVDNKVERLSLNGTFTIYYFLGPVDDSNVRSYPLNPTLCGFSHNFAAPVEACDNCGRHALEGHMVTDTNPITPMLLDYVEEGILADLSPECVTPFLIENLKWRIVTADGTRIDPRAVPGLSIGVSSKLTNLETGQVRYQDFADVVAQIIANAS